MVLQSNFRFTISDRDYLPLSQRSKQSLHHYPYSYRHSYNLILKSWWFSVSVSRSVQQLIFRNILLQLKMFDIHDLVTSFTFGFIEWKSASNSFL